MENPRKINRREFIATSSTIAGVAVGSFASTVSLAQSPSDGQRSKSDPSRNVAVVCDPDDKIVATPPVQWALDQLNSTFTARGIAVRRYNRIADVGSTEFCIVVAGARAAWLKEILRQAKISLPDRPETLALASAGIGDKTALFAVGTDARGLMYAVLEVVDQIAHSDPPLAVLEAQKPIIEQPANEIRSIARLFTSDVEDLPWFRDKSFWQNYLSMLAVERFNRFNLTLGLGYDFTRQIRDCYFYFAYPFLLAVPGYQVRAVGLPDADRDENLAMLRFISETAVARGIDFQLGLWTHAYQWTESPNANYTIDGLNADNHAAYCRAAMTALLAACPAISGVTLRTHGESGVAEGSYEFWQTVFNGVRDCGRKVEIDLHAKGIDGRIIDAALATGMPINVSPKFSAEHNGLPYHQAAIRSLEMPSDAQSKASDIGINRGLFSLTNGERKFMRYSYGDLMREDRDYNIMFRMWPGTQRLLLWGDPQMAAALGRSASFCGSKGMEFCEPLSFKGRKGSGLLGGRDAYQDASFKPAEDWEKYAYTYRLWGRLLYNPEAEPEIWQRRLRKNWGTAAPAAEQALAQASRILPLVTSVHLPSAANNNYWPEIYTNMSLVDASVRSPYSDTPSPKRFGTVSPLDPEIFCTIDEYGQEILSKKHSGKYSPVDVMHWLTQMTQQATKNLAEVEQKSGGIPSADLKRLIADVKIQIGLGEFFMRKIHSALLLALHQQGGSRNALKNCIEQYQAARDVWAKMAQAAEPVYVHDITFGMDKHLRGHWTDRLADIDQDLARMRKLREEKAVSPAEEPAFFSSAFWEQFRQGMGTLAPEGRRFPSFMIHRRSFMLATTS